MQISGWNNGFGLRGRYLLPVSGIRERGIETGVFGNGMVIVNHRSTPYELPQKYETEHYQMPVAYTRTAEGSCRDTAPCGSPEHYNRQGGSYAFFRQKGQCHL